MVHSIYLDHAATTPLHPDVRAAMEPFLGERFANPSSIYRAAQTARTALDGARDTVAGCLGASPAEIVFTSGATEANNAAIKGVALARRETHRHIVTTAIEHHAVLHPIEEMQELFGFETTVVPVQPNGIVDPADIQRAVRPDTALVSVMWANNEIGTLQPVEEIAELTGVRGIPLHVDAVQAVGYVPVDVRRIHVDLLSVSAHKIYGPKGTGALYLRRATPWWPLITGGGQERNRRAGTENVAGIVGLGCALSLAVSERSHRTEHARTLRDALLHGIRDRVPGIRVNGDMMERLPNNLNLSIEGVHGESLLLGLDLAGIMASSGSACTSGSLDPSHVLEALGLSDQATRGSLRLTVGRDNTMGEMERTAEVLAELVQRLRRLAPAVYGA